MTQCSIIDLSRGTLGDFQHPVESTKVLLDSISFRSYHYDRELIDSIFFRRYPDPILEAASKP